MQLTPPSTPSVTQALLAGTRPQARHLTARLSQFPGLEHTVSRLSCDGTSFNYSCEGARDKRKDSPLAWIHIFCQVRMALQAFFLPGVVFAGLWISAVDRLHNPEIRLTVRPTRASQGKTYEARTSSSFTGCDPNVPCRAIIMILSENIRVLVQSYQIILPLWS